MAIPRATGQPSFRAWVRPCKSARPRFQEKTTRINPLAVPKPTQVGGYKDTKARGRNLVKELGNMAP